MPDTERRRGPVQPSKQKLIALRALHQYPATSSLSSTAPFQLVLVGADQMVYQGLAALINQQSDLQVLEVLPALRELDYLIARVPLDVLIVDGKLVGPGSIGPWRRKHAHPRLRCLVLIAQPNLDEQEQYERAGALGYLSLQELPSHLFAAIRRIGYGQPVFYPSSALLSTQDADAATQPEHPPAFGSALQLSVNQAALEQACSYLRQDFAASIDWGIDGPLMQILPYLHLRDSELAGACGLSVRQVRYWCSVALYPLVSTLSSAQVDSRAAALAYLLNWHILEFDEPGMPDNERRRLCSQVNT